MSDCNLWQKDRNLSMDGRKQWELVEILGTRGIDIVSGLPLYVHRKCS